MLFWMAVWKKCEQSPKLLKKGGPEGQQAYAELQGQTVQYLQRPAHQNASGQLSFAKLKTAIDTLDREENLHICLASKVARH
jgi:hypothetical protein